MTKQNIHEYRGEDHGTRDTKETATDIGKELFGHLDEDSARYQGSQLLAERRRDADMLVRNMDRNSAAVASDEIRSGMAEHEAQQRAKREAAMSKLAIKVVKDRSGSTSIPVRTA